MTTRTLSTRTLFVDEHSVDALSARLLSVDTHSVDALSARLLSIDTLLARPLCSADFSLLRALQCPPSINRSAL